MKAISVDFNRRTHFLKAALCSQTWSRGTGVCTCTSHMCMFLSAGVLRVCSPVSVCIHVLCCLCTKTVHACFSVCISVNGSLSIRVCVCISLCVFVFNSERERERERERGQKVLHYTKYEGGGGKMWRRQ